MQRRSLYTVFVLFLLGGLALHFILTSVYSFQSLPVPAAVRQVSNDYSAPLFHQNWKMFAPSVPEYSNQLEYRFYADSSWSDWQDASAANGHGPRSRIEYIEQTLSTALAWQVANNLYVRDARRQFDHIVSGFDYGRAVYFAYSLHQRAQRLPMDSLQLRLQFRFTPAPGKAPTPQYSFLEFPASATR